MQFKSSASNDPTSQYLIKLKDGQFVTGILRGEVFEFEKLWKGAAKPTFRFRLNMITKENGVLVPKILEGGWKLYTQLKELHEGGWDLEKTTIKVSRKGSGQNDTTYTATPVPNGTLSPAALEQINAVPLLDLDPNQGERVPAMAGTSADDDVGF